MCAKKATSPAPRKPAAATAGKAVANGKASTAAAPPKPSERMLSCHDIGSVAGEIWGLLAQGESLSLAAIKKSIAAPSDVALAAVGWLAREDKLAFHMSGRTLKLSLKD